MRPAAAAAAAAAMAAPALCAALMAAGMFALTSVAVVSPARAECPFTVSAGQTITSEQTLTDNHDCTIEAGGVVDLGGNGNGNDSGIAMHGENNTFTNNGLITGFTHSGIYFNGAGGALIINSGDIITNADNVSAIVDSTGNIFYNEVINNGRIRIKGKNSRGLSAFKNNSFTNNGSMEIIDADGSNKYNYGSGQGVGFDSGIVFANNGTLFMVGNKDTAGVYAFSGDNNTIYNSGLVKAIPFDHEASNDDNDPYAIYFEGYSGYPSDGNRFVLLPGSLIIGKIGLGTSTSNADTYRNDHTLDVSNGMSVVLTFDDVGTMSNYKDPLFLPGTVESHGAPQFTNLDTRKIAVIDPTLLSVSDEVVTDVVNGSHGGVHGRLAQMRQGGQAQGDGGGGAGAPGGWLHAFGSFRKVEGSEPSADARVGTGGMVTGIDGEYDSNIMLGAFAGAARSQVEHQHDLPVYQYDFDNYEDYSADPETTFHYIKGYVDVQEEDINSFFGGLYASIDLGGANLNAILTAGQSSHDWVRVANNNVVVETETSAGDARSATGLQTYTADYNGLFVAPELSLSHAAAVSENVVVNSGIGLRYTHFSLDGFTESGMTDATENLTVEDRQLDILQVRVQQSLTISASTDQGAVRIAPHYGVEYRSLLGGNKASVVALDLPDYVSFDTGGEDTVFTGFAGINLHQNVGENAEFKAGIEAGLSNHGGRTISGQASLSIRF